MKENLGNFRPITGHYQIPEFNYIYFFKKSIQEKVCKKIVNPLLNEKIKIKRALGTAPQRRIHRMEDIIEISNRRFLLRLVLDS